MSRLGQFFEDDAGRLSMSRLLLLLSFSPATWLVLQDGTAQALGVFSLNKKDNAT